MSAPGERARTDETGTIGAWCPSAPGWYRAVMSSDLDVVVLGGAGHVGLPLSLTFADLGLKTGIYDISQPTLDRIAAGEMPFLETGAPELLKKVLASGRL